MKVRGNEFGDREVDVVLPFPDVIVKVAEPIHAVVPDDLPAYLPLRAERYVGTKRGFLVLPLR